MFVDDAAGVWRELLLGPLTYVWLILVLRVSGKRTLAQLNAFDFIVTVALGSTLATVVLSKSVAWVEGALVLVCWLCCSSWPLGCRPVWRSPAGC